MYRVPGPDSDDERIRLWGRQRGRDGLLYRLLLSGMLPLCLFLLFMFSTRLVSLWVRQLGDGLRIGVLLLFLGALGSIPFSIGLWTRFWYRRYRGPKGLLVIVGWLGLTVLTFVICVLIFQDAVAFELRLGESLELAAYWFTFPVGVAFGLLNALPQYFLLPSELRPAAGWILLCSVEWGMLAIGWLVLLVSMLLRVY